MRRVIVWRHGETAHNAGGIYQGHLDTPLSDRGVQQAEAAAQTLAAREVSLLVASDLDRAASTAAALGRRTGVAVRTDPRWREIDVGRWEGRAHVEIAAEDPEVLAALDRGEDVVRGGTGERVADLQVRTREAFERLLDELGEGRTAVVATHGLASRALVAEVVGLTYRQAWLSLVGLHNCHWAELVEHRTGWRLDSWNVGVAASVGSVTDR
jgi:probable phosphoglycerate mutase